MNEGLVYIYPMALCIHIYTTISLIAFKSKYGGHNQRRFARFWDL